MLILKKFKKKTQRWSNLKRCWKLNLYVKKIYKDTEDLFEFNLGVKILWGKYLDMSCIIEEVTSC